MRFSHVYLLLTQKKVRLINVWYIKAPGCRWQWDVPPACQHTLAYNLSIPLKHTQGLVACGPSGASQSITESVFLTPACNILPSKMRTGSSNRPCTREFFGFFFSFGSD